MQMDETYMKALQTFALGLGTDGTWRCQMRKQGSYRCSRNTSKCVEVQKYSESGVVQDGVTKVQSQWQVEWEGGTERGVGAWSWSSFNAMLESLDGHSETLEFLQRFRAVESSWSDLHFRKKDSWRTAHRMDQSGKQITRRPLWGLEEKEQGFDLRQWPWKWKGLDRAEGIS